MHHNKYENGCGRMLLVQHNVNPPLSITCSYREPMRHPSYYTDNRPPYSYSVEFQRPNIYPRPNSVSSYTRFVSRSSSSSSSCGLGNGVAPQHQVLHPTTFVQQNTPPPPPPYVKPSKPLGQQSDTTFTTPERHHVLYPRHDSHTLHDVSTEFLWKNRHDKSKTLASDSATGLHYKLFSESSSTDRNLSFHAQVPVRESLSASHSMKPSGGFLEEGEVEDLTRMIQTQQEIPIDQISSVSDEDDDADYLEDVPHEATQNESGKQKCEAQQAFFQKDSHESTYSFWLGRVQIRLVEPGSSDPTTRTPTNHVIVFKLSNLNLSPSSPLLDDFAHFFLPTYRQILNESKETRPYLAEVYLMQSRLTAQSLHVLLTSFTSNSFIPTTLHLGSNLHLGSDGMVVLATFITKSKEPLRWLALSKCDVTLPAFQKVLDALLNRMDIYPRMHNGVSVPIWIDLPNFIQSDHSTHDDDSISSSITFKMFAYIDRIRPNLYCLIKDRIACGINRCGTPGSFFHIPKLNSLSKRLLSSQSNQPLGSQMTGAEPSSDHNGELSEIDSDEDKDRSVPYPRSSSSSSVRTLQCLYSNSMTDPKSDGDTLVHQALCLTYQSLLRNAFLSIAFLASEHQVFPSQFLMDLMSIYLEGKNSSKVHLPALWSAFPKAILNHLLNAEDPLASIDVRQKNNSSRKRHRAELEEQVTDGPPNTFSSVTSSIRQLVHQDTSKIKSSQSNQSAYQPQLQSSHLTASPQSSHPTRLDNDELLSSQTSSKSNQYSPSEEGEIQDTFLET